ncbi:hypothetical protein C8R44DRAFT_143927 [Mycena epipterygia]|nr:hypothetical protein C8R44DRAFT_143927 [Mycena epipterygia]
MGQPPNPLHIQELLEQCREFLRDSTSDLKACALVSRSWACAAQPPIFRDVYITLSARSKNERLLSRLQEALRISPHLIRHIRRLEICPSNLSTESFSVIGNLSFKNLTHLAIKMAPELSLPSAIAIQQLLAVATLRRAWISCRFSEPSIFLRVWERCSPSIVHLQLHCF